MCLSYGLGHYLKITHDNSCRDHLANKPTLPLWPKTSFFLNITPSSQIIVRPEFFDSPISSPDDGQTEQHIVRPHQLHRTTTDRRNIFVARIYPPTTPIARQRTDETFLGIFETRDIYFRDRQIYGIFIFRDRPISRSPNLAIIKSRDPGVPRSTHFAKEISREFGIS